MRCEPPRPVYNPREALSSDIRRAGEPTPAVRGDLRLSDRYADRQHASGMQRVRPAIRECLDELLRLLTVRRPPTIAGQGHRAAVTMQQSALASEAKLAKLGSFESR